VDLRECAKKDLVGIAQEFLGTGGGEYRDKKE